MKIVTFPEVTTVAAKDQPEYHPLPCYIDPGPDGTVVSCWQYAGQTESTNQELKQ